MSMLPSTLSVSDHALRRFRERVLGATGPCSSARLRLLEPRLRRWLRRFGRGGVRRGWNPEDGSLILVKGSRALVLRESALVTIIVADGPRGFSKRWWRRLELDGVDWQRAAA